MRSFSVVLNITAHHSNRPHASTLAYLPQRLGTTLVAEFWELDMVFIKGSVYAKSIGLLPCIVFVFFSARGVVRGDPY